MSHFRLYLLRVAYLVIAVGLGLHIWPSLLDPPRDLEHMRGVARALLAAVGLLALIGIRYPLQMLPLLRFEFVRKSIWVVAIGLPLWYAGAFTGATRQTWIDCWFGIALCLAVIPWRYVLAAYVRARGERWRKPSYPTAPDELKVGEAV